MSNPNPTPPPIPSFDQIVKGNVCITKLKNKKNMYRITFSKIGTFLVYQVWDKDNININAKRDVFRVSAKKWVNEFIKLNEYLKKEDKELFTPTTIIETATDDQYACVICKACINSHGRIVFTVSTKEIQLSNNCSKKLTQIQCGRFNNVRFDIDDAPLVTYTYTLKFPNIKCGDIGGENYNCLTVAKINKIDENNNRILVESINLLPLLEMRAVNRINLFDRLNINVTYNYTDSTATDWPTKDLWFVFNIVNNNDVTSSKLDDLMNDSGQLIKYDDDDDDDDDDDGGDDTQTYYIMSSRPSTEINGQSPRSNY
jgi:hypothetical protein